MRKISASEDSSISSKFSIVEYWRILWRKKHMILIPVLIPTIAAGFGVRYLVPVYEAGSIVRMENKGLLSREVQRYVQLSQQRRIQDRETLARIKADIATSSFLDELSQRLGMDKNPSLRRWAEVKHRTKYPDLSVDELMARKLREKLLKKLNVDRTGPGMFKISCNDYDPEVCYVVANEAMSLFINMQQLKEIENLQEASDFSDENLTVYKERMERSERELERFKKKLSKLKYEINPVRERNIGYAETHLRQIKIRLNDQNNIVSRIRENIVALFGAMPSGNDIWSDEDLKKLENKFIAQVETRLFLELATKGETSKDLQNNSQEIEQTRKDISHYLSNLVLVSYPEIYKDYRPLVVEYYVQQLEKGSIEQKKKLLASYITAFRQRLQLAPQWDRELKKLQEDVETNKAIYNSFLKAKTSAQISESAQNTNLGFSIEILEKAKKPLIPIKPNKPKIIVIAILFGGFLGIGSLLLSEYSDTSFRSLDEIQEQLGLKVLGTIPKFQIEELKTASFKIKKAIVWSVVSVAALVIAVLGFYYYGKSSSKKGLDIRSSSGLQSMLKK